MHQGLLSLLSLRGRLMSSSLCKWVTEVTARCGRGLVHHAQHLLTQQNGDEHHQISDKLWERQELVVNFYDLLHNGPTLQLHSNTSKWSTGHLQLPLRKHRLRFLSCDCRCMLQLYDKPTIVLQVARWWNAVKRSRNWVKPGAIWCRQQLTTSFCSSRISSRLTSKVYR